MRRCAMLLLIGLTLTAAGTARADTELLAYLGGENEVPPVRTPGNGIAYFYIPDDLSYIYYYVYYSDLQGDAVQAHLHLGLEGTNGPVIFDLAGIPGGIGAEYDGILTRRAFQPTARLRTYEQAIRAIVGGRTYVNIHTTAHRTGEIRGQAFVP